MDREVFELQDLPDLLTVKNWFQYAKKNTSNVMVRVASCPTEAITVEE
jgi:ferredoxin